MNDESIDAENRANEITDWLNGLKVRVAVRICCAYTKKKLSSFNVEDDEKSDDANHELNDENEEENARKRSDEKNMSDSLCIC
jgi:hypothetical protein